MLDAIKIDTWRYPDLNSIADIRKKLMSTRKVICTGNPDRPGTLAQGFCKIFPDATFLCKSTGWDLTDTCDSNIHRLKEVFKGKNTFLNCSYIGPGVQEKLLGVCHDTLKFCDVINIGSTHEFDDLGQHEYKQSKLNLRNKSLCYNDFRFSTCHLILGGIKNNDDPKKINWLEIDKICETVIWIWNQQFHVPLICVDQRKESW